jgi:hypothetical protein
MDTLDSPRFYLFSRPTPAYIAWRVPNPAKLTNASKTCDFRAS